MKKSWNFLRFLGRAGSSLFVFPRSGSRSKWYGSTTLSPGIYIFHLTPPPSGKRSGKRKKEGKREKKSTRGRIMKKSDTKGGGSIFSPPPSLRYLRGGKIIILEKGGGGDYDNWGKYIPLLFSIEGGLVCT